MRAALRRILTRHAPHLALRTLNLDRPELGIAGEAVAARALRRAGWTLVARRARTPLAEIDLVVRAGDWLVCVEVKTSRAPRWPGPIWRGRDRVSARTLARQSMAAGWLASRLGASRCRVDLIEVEVDRDGAAHLQHLPDLPALKASGG